MLDAGTGSASALTAPDRTGLTFDGLRQHVDAIGRQLSAHGLGAGDRVAIVLPNGPELPVEESGAAGFGPDQPQHTFEQGRLAGTIGTYHSQTLTAIDAEAHVVGLNNDNYLQIIHDDENNLCFSSLTTTSIRCLRHINK